MFEKIQMGINTVEVQGHSEHGLKSNFMNLFYTNQSTKETVLETTCYSPDTGEMDASDTNQGFQTRLSFFRYTTKDSQGTPVYKYRDNPVTFMGKNLLIEEKLLF